MNHEDGDSDKEANEKINDSVESDAQKEHRKKMKKKGDIERSKSFDLRNMFSFRSSTLPNEQIDKNSRASRSLHRNSSQPETAKLGTIRKSILDHTQSMKKTTADFFGVNKEREDVNYQLWLEKRKRFYLKSGGKVKEKSFIFNPVSSDTNDSQHLFAGDFDPSLLGTPGHYGLLGRSFNSSKTKPSVMSLAVKGMKNIQQTAANRRSMNLVADRTSPHSPSQFDVTGAIAMRTIGFSKGDQQTPREVVIKTCDMDHTAGDYTNDQRLLEPTGEKFDLFSADRERYFLQETLDAPEFLPEDLQFDYAPPPCATKTWKIVERPGRPRINSKLIESIYDNSDRRQYGMGIIGRLLNRRFKSNLTNEEKEILNSIYDSRPYFTYWIMCVQLVIMTLALLTYGFGHFGLQRVKITDTVLVNSLSIQEVSYSEPNNIWLGPRPADLIHLGAKFTPCMRKDKLIFDEITKERKEERDTACCIRTDRSGCIQTKKDECSPLLSYWMKSPPAQTSKFRPENNRTDFRPSYSVCGQDPKYCQDPKSFFPNVWPDDITKWPICRQQRSVPRGGLTDQDAHMKCDLIGKPCCIGIHGQCKITTRDYCDFVHGFFHEEATLCSQVSCMSDVCGMIQIKRDDNLFQIYRLFTSLFLHAGFLHIFISFTFQFYIMRDFEKLIGSSRICIIYFVSGIGGNLASAIFVPYRAEVGPGGSQFGILAGLIAEHLHSWNLIENPGHQLFKLLGIAFVLFIYGLFPWIDNFAHIFGFVIGFLLSIALLPFLTFTQKVKRRLKIVIIWSCFVIVFIFFIVLLSLLYKFPIYECKYCSYFNCIPLTNDWCSDHQIAINRKDIL